jgi:hypothetical protein
LECFHTPGGLDIDGFLERQGCAVPKMDTERHGAIGRVRMVAGFMRRAAAQKRSVKIGAQTFGEKASKKPTRSAGVIRRSQRRGNNPNCWATPP